MRLIRVILFPLSILYAGLMHVRNKQFDTGQRRQTAFDRVVISVGNLSTGGTGKTPMVEYLVRTLKDKVQLATISRGYGRKTKGFRLATTADTALTIGDEPLQLFRKFGDEITVAVGEERILAIPLVLMAKEQTSLFLLDDAFQHRQVGRDFDILLSDYACPFYKDYVLPTGNLRESRQGAGRANAIVITKCPPELTEKEKRQIRVVVAKYNADAPVYFSQIKYQKPKLVFHHAPIESNIVLLTGVAKTNSIMAHLSETYEIVKHFKYPDHYNFRAADLDDVEKNMMGLNVKTLVTTEKDMVRLLPFEGHSLFQKTSLYYLPITIQLDNEEMFQAQLNKVIERHKT